MSEFNGPEFVVGSAKGIRVWRADSLGRLTGWTHRQVWTPNENVATCLRNKVDLGGYYSFEADLREPCAEVNVNCGCGFWAYHSGTPQIGDGAGVVGVVEGYGRTTIGTKGFRASKARILALAFPKSDCGCGHDVPFKQSADIERLVRRAYPEVAYFNSVEAMVAEFPPDAPELPGPDSPDFWTMADPNAEQSLSYAGMTRAISKMYSRLTIPASSFTFYPDKVEVEEDADEPEAVAPDPEPEPRRRWWGGAR